MSGSKPAIEIIAPLEKKTSRVGSPISDVQSVIDSGSKAAETTGVTIGSIRENLAIQMAELEQSLAECERIEQELQKTNTPAAATPEPVSPQAAVPQKAPTASPEESTVPQAVEPPKAPEAVEQVPVQTVIDNVDKRSKKFFSIVGEKLKKAGKTVVNAGRSVKNTLKSSAKYVMGLAALVLLLRACEKLPTADTTSAAPIENSVSHAVSNRTQGKLILSYTPLDYGTPEEVERNEKKLGYEGKDKDGNFQFNIASMMQDSSDDGAKGHKLSKDEIRDGIKSGKARLILIEKFGENGDPLIYREVAFDSAGKTVVKKESEIAKHLNDSNGYIELKDAEKLLAVVENTNGENMVLASINNHAGAKAKNTTTSQPQPKSTVNTIAPKPDVKDNPESTSKGLTITEKAQMKKDIQTLLNDHSLINFDFLNKELSGMSDDDLGFWRKKLEQIQTYQTELSKTTDPLTRNMLQSQLDGALDEAFRKKGISEEEEEKYMDMTVYDTLFDIDEAVEGSDSGSVDLLKDKTIPFFDFPFSTGVTPVLKDGDYYYNGVKLIAEDKGDGRVVYRMPKTPAEIMGDSDPIDPLIITPLKTTDLKATDPKILNPQNNSNQIIKPNEGGPSNILKLTPPIILLPN